MKKYFGLLAMILSVTITSCDKDTVDGGGVNVDTLYGCTDVNALNYNASATDDNGSCEYSVAYTVSGEWVITFLEYETEYSLFQVAKILLFCGFKDIQDFDYQPYKINNTFGLQRVERP